MLYYFTLYLRGKEIYIFLKGISTSKMQTTLARTWTWVANFISYNDNHYTKHASIIL